MQGAMTLEKTAQLWEAVLQQPTYKKVKLRNKYTSDQIAFYVIKTTIHCEHMAARFRKAGGKYVSVRPIWGSDEIKVRVCGYKQPLKPFTDKDFNDLVAEYGRIHRGETK